MQYPEIYRKRVIEYRQAGHTLKDTHEIFQISIRAIQNWKKRLAKTGEIKNKPVKRSFKKLDPEKLKTYIENHPDAYLKEIAQEFGCSAPAVLKALRRMGFTRKKKTKHYKEQDPEKVKAYLEEIALYQPEQIAYVDESGIDSYLYREYGWSPRGQ